MFTGIIREIGLVKRKTPSSNKGLLLTIQSEKLNPQIGQSISVDGACLTVIKKIKKNITFEVISETLLRTRFNDIREGDGLNLEPSLRIGDALDGHMVTGHVDTAIPLLLAKSGFLTFAVPKTLAHFIIEKGSVALNGVSLTLARVTPKTFSVALTTHTHKNTNIGNLKKGDLVNLEIDLLARYSRGNENRHRGLKIPQRHFRTPRSRSARSVR